MPDDNDFKLKELQMPIIGDVKRGRKIGYKNNRYHIWLACIDCGKGRWVQCRGSKHLSGRCMSCSSKRLIHPIGSKSSRWRGGRHIAKTGYVHIKVYPGDFFYSMANKNGYVLEHRLVVAKALGRNLHRWEIVHHKHDRYPAGSIEDKQDNRYPENLQLVSDDRHKQITILENRIGRLEAKVEEQTKLIKLLQWQLKQGVEKYG